MNNYTNMTNTNTGMNIRAFEIAEAKRRMGTPNPTPQNMGMTNSVPTNVPSLSSSTSIGNVETQQARQSMGTSNYTPQSMGMTSYATPSSNMNNYTNLSSLNSVPGLNSSTSVGYGEIQKAKQDMFQGSSRNFMS